MLADFLLEFYAVKLARSYLACVCRALIICMAEFVPTQNNGGPARKFLTIAFLPA